jgi:hypothetical protein
MDRFRSLPMTRSALLTGRTLGDVVTNIFQLVGMFTVGLLVGFNFSSSVGEVVAGIALLLLIGYAFSWVFAFIGFSSSSPEAPNASGSRSSSPSPSSRRRSSRSTRCPAGYSRSPSTTRSRPWSTPPAPCSWGFRPSTTSACARLDDRDHRRLRPLSAWRYRRVVTR